MADPIYSGTTENPYSLTTVGLWKFASPTFVDINNDGDFDAFIGNSDGNTLYFQNTGTASAPSYAAASTNPFGMSDVGAFANPTFVDINGDGDLDAFIGNSAGDTLYFENTGNAGSPAFAAPISNPFGLANVFNNASPVFADLDNDGDKDALIGNGIQTAKADLRYFQNTGTASSPAFAAPVTNPFNLIIPASSTRASPELGDIDGDGDLDLFVGRYTTGTPFLFFRNAGTPSSPNFTNSTLNPFSLTGQYDYQANPDLIDIDGDGDLDLFVGYYSGNTRLYLNSAPVPDTTAPVLQSAATNAGGTKIILTYNEALSATTANMAAFTIRADGNTIAAPVVQAVGSTIELILTTPVAGGQAVVVAYADPSSANETNATQDAAGNDAATLPGYAVTNNVPDTTAPVLQSAATSTDGTAIILNYSEALSATTAAPTAFVVTVGGTPNIVENALVSGSTIVLKLTDAITGGQAVSLTYTDPTGGNDPNAVQDATGNDSSNDATNITSTAVANNVGKMPVQIVSSWTQVGGEQAAFHATATDSAGNLYAVGNYSRTYKLDGPAGSKELPDTGTSISNTDNYLVKYDKDGNILWTKLFTSAGGGDAMNDVKIDSAGNV